MISDPERVGHDGQSRIHRAAGAEKAAIDDVEIVHVVRFAVYVKCAGPRIVAEANRSYLVRYTCQRNSLTNV